jgi:hypothetical protein
VVLEPSGTFLTHQSNLARCGAKCRQLEVQQRQGRRDETLEVRAGHALDGRARPGGQLPGIRRTALGHPGFLELHRQSPVAWIGHADAGRQEIGHAHPEREFPRRELQNLEGLRLRHRTKDVAGFAPQAFGGQSLEPQQERQQQSCWTRQRQLEWWQGRAIEAVRPRRKTRNVR